TEFLAGRRLHGHALDVDASNSCDTGAYGVAMGRDARGLANDCEVKVSDAAAPGPHPFDGESKKLVGSGASPLWTGWGEVRANRALRDRTKHRVRNRMERDIGVGMSGECLVVCNAYPAEGHVIARAERVHVQPRADANIAERGKLLTFRA